MPNRLASATSPYLLQHADNPVDWFVWGEEAFVEAERRNVPVLLSVGYSACHWCHVMAHESFEDPDTADYMNRHFVNVKVDREERPDVDRIYMDAVQAMTGRGGWPMTVFMDATGRPFFAGTYFPKTDRHGHPSFRRVMESIVDAWVHRRADVDEQSQRLTDAIRRSLPPAPTTPTASLVEPALTAIVGTHDPEHGGFGGAPKFPQVPTLEFLVRAVATGRAGHQREAAVAVIEHTLDRMAAGGIHDHLGGGFARYSVDRAWLVPHFEKMLYDNALLARLYIRAGQVIGRDDFTSVARRTLDYLITDMTHPDGGLYSAEDADSEGVEGKFYVWSWEDLGDVLGEDRRWAAAIYGASPQGNFEGATILERFRPMADVAESMGTDVEEAAASKLRVDAALLAARRTRVRPGLDDKVLAAWNGLALWAFAEAAAVLDDARYLEHATGIAEFALEHLRRSDGRLLRSWRNGRPGVAGFCEDYAAMAIGLFALYQASGRKRWFDAGEALTRSMLDLFADPDADGLFATARDADALITRPKNHMDNPTPSGNSLAAEALQILAAFTGDQDLLTARDRILRAGGMVAERHPAAAGHLLSVLVTGAAGIREVAIVGVDRDPLVSVIWSAYRPDVVVAAADGASPSPPLLSGRDPLPVGATAFVCREFVCDMPVTSPGELAALLEP